MSSSWLGSGVLLAVAATMPITPASVEAAEKVHLVQDIRLIVIKSEPPQLLITVTGTTVNPFWTAPELEPYFYADGGPVDGVYEFDFMAEAPDEPTVLISTPIVASVLLKRLPSNLKGVRIHARNGKGTKPLAEATERRVK